jgi:hypothetical protein
VLIRVIAILIAFGLFAGAVDARALDTPATATLSVSIEESDDVADLEVVLPEVTPLDPESGAFAALITSDIPPHYEHCWFVFRPPRTYAFN